jgi:pyruvate kinase
MIRTLYDELRVIRAALIDSEAQAEPLLAAVCAAQRASALNLVQYLALRRRDHRGLQDRLAAQGLSSLGRSESHVLAQVDAVLVLLASLLGERHERAEGAVSASEGQALLREHAEKLLGASPKLRRVRLMVTLPSQVSREQVVALMRAGMDCARINAAHDDLAEWRTMARHVRDAAQELGRPCAIAVDLAGPKCRTGALEPGPEVLKLKPERDAYGVVVKPARAWLTTRASSHAPALPVRETFLDRLRVGGKLKLRDARGHVRRFQVESLADGAAEISSTQTAYIRRGTRIRGAGDEATIGHLARVEQPLRLYTGDMLALTRSDTPGHPARANGHEPPLACIPCEPPELLDMLRAGESVWFDDGRIGAIVERVEHDRTLLRITSARPQGENLRSGKGINLPDSDLRLPSLTDADRQAVAFAVEAADLVQLSFVHAPEDVYALQDLLESMGRPELGLVLKIETRAGFARLPELLLAAMRTGVPGVMIARGDLAVECGFERLSEVQEEILWLCEAAHVPVVWATQVLDTMAKSGRPTRAEVTDAAMAERAECVMLNKGPYIVETLALLDDILRRMSAHQDKKASMFRALEVAERFAQQLEGGSAPGWGPPREGVPLTTA